MCTNVQLIEIANNVSESRMEIFHLKRKKCSFSCTVLNLRVSSPTEWIFAITFAKVARFFLWFTFLFFIMAHIDTSNVLVALLVDVGAFFGTTDRYCLDAFESIAKIVWDKRRNDISFWIAALTNKMSTSWQKICNRKRAHAPGN